MDGRMDVWMDAPRLHGAIRGNLVSFSAAVVGGGSTSVGSGYGSGMCLGGGMKFGRGSCSTGGAGFCYSLGGSGLGAGGAVGSGGAGFCSVGGGCSSVVGGSGTTVTSSPVSRRV